MDMDVIRVEVDITVADEEKFTTEEENNIKSMLGDHLFLQFWRCSTCF